MELKTEKLIIRYCKNLKIENKWEKYELAKKWYNAFYDTVDQKKYNEFIQLATREIVD